LDAKRREVCVENPWNIFLGVFLDKEDVATSGFVFRHEAGKIVQLVPFALALIDRARGDKGHMLDG
jgi:hypothetical protein